MKIELTGVKDFDAKVTNLNNTIETLSKYIDVSKYQEELDSLINKMKGEYNSHSDTVSRGLSSNMQVDYAKFSSAPYIKKIDEITKNINTKELPFYYIYALNNELSQKMKNHSIENIGDIVETAKKLLESIDRIDIYDSEDKRAIVAESCKNILDVLLVESVYERNDLLNYVIIRTGDLPKEKISQEIIKHLEKNDNADTLNESLKGVRVEGLEYDPINEKILFKIAMKERSKDRKKYAEDKKEEIKAFTKEVEDFSDYKKEAKKEYEDAKNQYKRMNRDMRRILVGTGALVLAPIALITSGISLATNTGDTEFETTVTEYDITNDGLYSKSTDYKTEKEVKESPIIIKKYGPLVQKDNTYIRTITKYEYDGKLNIDNGSMPSVEEIQNHLVRIGSEIEEVASIDDIDKANEEFYTIEHSVIDKSLLRRAKHPIFGIIWGTFFSIIIDLLIMVVMSISTDSKLDYEEITEKYNKEKDKLKEIEAKRKELEEKEKMIRDKYGIHENDLVFSNLDEEKTQKLL